MSVYPQTEQKPIVSAIKRNETASRNLSPPVANRFQSQSINLSFCSFDFVIPKTQRGQKGNLFSPEPTSKPRSRWDHNQDQNQLQSHDKTRCGKSCSTIQIILCLKLAKKNTIGDEGSTARAQNVGLEWVSGWTGYPCYDY